MKLGLNLSHESGAALTTKSGKVIFAIEEERLSRKKGENRFPIHSLRAIGETFDTNEIDEIIVGSMLNIDIRDVARFNAEFDDFISGVQLEDSRYLSRKYSPGFPVPRYLSQENLDRNIIKLIVDSIQLNKKQSLIKNKFSEVTWVKHHNSHIGSGIPYVSDKPSIILSLDGEGDGESGSVAFAKNRLLTDRTMVSSRLDSLGHLYREVTGYYGHTKSRHEGKITGLAAYGKYSKAVDILNQFVKIKNGRVSFNYSHNPDIARVVSFLKRLGLPIKQFTSLENVVEAAAQNIIFWPDLAFAVQDVVENAVVEIAQYWLEKFGAEKLVLVGGVFANVKLNQKLSELPQVSEVEVFPNMGDGGLSLGGVWYTLSNRNEIGKDNLFENMYLSDEYFAKFTSSEAPEIHDKVTNKSIGLEEKIKLAVGVILKGGFVGIHQYGVEFGPRALGNRSIVFDPRRADLVKILNSRLGRTDYMPFAPVVLEEHFSDWFETSNQSMQPFKFMAMTCNVKSNCQELIPAVVHVDGTARPQTISENENLLFYKIVKAFFYETGVPLLVNTSFNMHEEPINGGYLDSIKALQVGAIDLIVHEKGIFLRK